MREITQKLYTFSELGPEARAKAIENNRDINTDDFSDWYNPITEYFVEKVEKLGYEDIEPMFSGFYSQGDGACFTARVYISNWIKAHKLKKKFALLYKYGTADYCYIKISHSYHHYFSTSTDVNECDDFWQVDSSKTQDKLTEQLAEVTKLVEEERKNLGDQLYKDLETYYYKLTSDDMVAESLLANDVEFLEDGNKY